MRSAAERAARSAGSLVASIFFPVVVLFLLLLDASHVATVAFFSAASSAFTAVWNWVRSSIVVCRRCWLSMWLSPPHGTPISTTDDGVVAAVVAAAASSTRLQARVQ